MEFLRLWLFFTRKTQKAADFNLRMNGSIFAFSGFSASWMHKNPFGIFGTLKTLHVFMGSVINKSVRSSQALRCLVGRFCGFSWHIIRAAAILAALTDNFFTWEKMDSKKACPVSQKFLRIWIRSPRILEIFVFPARHCCWTKRSS